MAKIADIEGIGPAYSEKLATAGVSTTNALLKAGASKKGRKALADSTGISEKMILEWTNMADLFRVKGVSTQYAELLEAAGVDTVKELRNRNAKNLHAKMKEVNAEKKLVRQIPGATMVEKYVEHAKTLEPIITY